MIHVDQTDAHGKLIQEIHECKDIVLSEKPSINDLVVSERVRTAFLYVITLSAESSNVLSIAQICHMNRLLGCDGKLRAPAASWFDSNNIGVNGYRPPEGEEVEPLLAEYLKKYISGDESKEPLEKICVSYWLFEQIHPFIEGNGRTGRLICAWMMMKYGYGFLSPYIEARWGSENREHAEAFKSSINHYLAWSTYPDYCKEFFRGFYLYFLKEIAFLLNSHFPPEKERSAL